MRQLPQRRSVARRIAARARFRRLALENLESRHLLASGRLTVSSDVGSVLLQGQTLLVSGTERGDDIWLQSRTNGLHVWINGKRQGPYHPERVVVYAQGGNDSLHADAKVTLPLE